MNPQTLLKGYPATLISQVEMLIQQNKLSAYLENKYPEKNSITTNKALYDYVMVLKKQYMKKAPPIHKVLFDDSIDRVYKALGLHSSVSRVQGKKLKSKSEIRVASLFKDAPEEFLHMIVVHELAHLKEKNHNKEFYRLCCHMEGDYFQLELDLRLYLISLELSKA